MKLPIKFDLEGRPFSDSIKESEHFEAYGKPTFTPDFKGDGYRLLVQNGVESVEKTFDPVDWNKQTCYDAIYPMKRVRLRMTNPDGKRRRYDLEKRQFYFLMEFGFLRANLKQACGNTRCYNPYHQTFARNDEHYTSTPEQFTLTVPYLESQTMSAYFRAAREMGMTPQQTAEMSPVVFFQKTLEYITQHEEEYLSPLENHLKSGLLGDTALDAEPLEVEPCISGALEQARQAARDAGNIDAYVLINDLMRRITLQTSL